MRFPIRFVLPLFALALVGSLAVQADTLISNLPGNDLTQSADLDNLRNKGMGFTMPTGLGYTLDRVTLRLETFGANVTPIVELWSDVAGLPGVSLISLNNPSFNPSGVANYDFTPSGSFTLQPSTVYWIVAYGTATGDRYDWKGSSPAQTPTGLATHFGSKFDTNGPPPTTNSSILCSYSIDGTIIPEPGVGLALVVGSIVLARRRR